jgi:hypothetical protein
MLTVALFSRSLTRSFSTRRAEVPSTLDIWFLLNIRNRAVCRGATALHTARTVAYHACRQFAGRATAVAYACATQTEPTYAE